jgi:hypothetical protein
VVESQYWISIKSEGVAGLMLRRVFGLFWPIFGSKVEGSYTKVDMNPQLWAENSAQKNRKIDRRLNQQHPLSRSCQIAEPIGMF